VLARSFLKNGGNVSRHHCTTKEVVNARGSYGIPFVETCYNLLGLTTKVNIGTAIDTAIDGAIDNAIEIYIQIHGTYTLL